MHTFYLKLLPDNAYFPELESKRTLITFCYCFVIGSTAPGDPDQIRIIRKLISHAIIWKYTYFLSIKYWKCSPRANKGTERFFLRYICRNRIYDNCRNCCNFNVFFFVCESSFVFTDLSANHSTSIFLSNTFKHCLV